MVGKARGFSDEDEEAVYQQESDSENYSLGGQQNSYNLGSTQFSDQSGIGNFQQGGDDQRKANLSGCLFNGNVGFNLQLSVLNVGTDTLNINQDETGADGFTEISTDVFVSLSAGTTSDLVTIIGAQRPGQRLRLYNTLTNTITIKHTAAATPNTIRTPSAGDLTFPPNGAIDFTYDITTAQWRVVGNTGSGGGGNVPVGTAENQHLEWNNGGGVWEAKDFLEFNPTGPHALTGSLRFPNDVIWAAGRTGLDDGNLELKFTTNNELDFTNSNKTSNVALLLRAQDLADPPNSFRIQQNPGTNGDAIFTAPNNMAFFVDTTTAVALMDNTHMTMALPISMNTLEIFLDADEDSGIFSSVDDTVQVFTNNIIRAAFQDTLFTVGTELLMQSADIDMNNNDIKLIQALLFNDIGGQIAVADDAAGFNLVNTSATRPFRFTSNAANILDISDSVGLTMLGTHNIALGNNNVTGVNQIAFNEANQTITDDTNGMRFSLPDSTDTYDFTTDSNLNMSIEKFFINMKNSRIQMTQEIDPGSPLAGDINVYSKLDSGIAKLFYKQSDGTVVGPLAAGGAGSQTPWTSDIDAAGFDLQSLSNLEFQTTTGAPGAGVQAIWADANGMRFNVPTSDDFTWTVQGVDQVILDATRLAPNIAGLDLGSQTFPWEELSVKSIEFETGGNITINKNTVAVDAGGTTWNVPTGDSWVYSINGTDNITLSEDQIDFQTGRAHRISATNTSLQLLSENISDSVQIWPGTGRSNEALIVQDLNSIFKSAASGTDTYELLVRYSNATTTGQPAIGNIGTEAEDSANVFSAYAGIATAIEDDTSTSRDGRMQLVVADGNTAATRGLGQLSGVGLDIQGNNGALKIGLFGVTPVVRPTITGSRGGNAALADLLTKGAGVGYWIDSTTA